MKMINDDFVNLSHSINETLKMVPDAAIQYEKNNISHMRYRWDILHASKYDTASMYKYLDDSNIDTALRKILGDNWKNWTKHNK